MTRWPDHRPREAVCHRIIVTANWSDRPSIFVAENRQISYLKGFYRGHSIPAEVRQEFMTDGMSKNTQEAFLSYFQNFRMGQEYLSRAHTSFKHPCWWYGASTIALSASSWRMRLRKSCQNAKLEVIDKSGHYVHMDKPQELVQVVIKFLHEAA